MKIYALYAGALLHFLTLIASVSTPGTLDWRKQLAGLHPFLRTLFWVYGVFIFMVILGFGTITAIAAPELASGTLLARAFCGFVAIFWLARLVVQLTVFDPSEFLTTWFLKAGYQVLTLMFIAQVLIYGWMTFL